MDKEKNYGMLKDFCLKEGMDLFGVADISGIKNDFLLSKKTLEKFNHAICLAVRLSESVLGENEKIPAKIYFYHYRTANTLLDLVAFKLTGLVQKAGFAALPIPATQVLDWDAHSAHLSHKELGVLAGFGWIGRNNLLVNKDLGSQFRLVSILTDMPLKIDRPSQENCGECRACIAVCPAVAIKENTADFDHLKCFETIKDFQKRRMIDQYVCGICVRACAGGRK